MTIPKFKPDSFGALDFADQVPDLEGNISVRDKGLTSLDGCPEIVALNFSCSYNQSLTALVGGPKEVGCDYYALNC
jgi:hypothetical protein